MTEIYSNEYCRQVKKQYSMRLALLILCIALFAAGYVISIITPQIKWLTMVIAIAGALVCCSAGIMLLTRPGKKRRLLRDIKNGLTTEETLTFEQAGPDVNRDMYTYSTLMFIGTDETGRDFERELLFEGQNSFTPGDTVRILSHRGFITAYEIL